VGAHNVRLCMRFLRVYGFRLGLWFAFGFMVFRWVSGCLLSSCFSFGSMVASFLWVYFTLMFCQVWVYSYTEEQQCASNKVLGRCNGAPIDFSPAQPVSLA